VMTDISGDAAAGVYLKLAQEPKQKQWHYTFVKGKGYVDFGEFKVGLEI
jgi:hypothetical protein